VLKHWSKTHSSLRQSNLQQQNPAALMSCRIRAVEHRKCAAGLAGTHPGLQDRILLNYTRIENAHKVRKKTFNFLCIEVQQTFSFLLVSRFSNLRQLLRSHFKRDVKCLVESEFSFTHQCSKICLCDAQLHLLTK